MLPWLIGIAAALLFVVFAPMRKRGRHGLIEEVDPVLRMRWRDRRPSTQIAGRKCLDCESEIVIETDAIRCKPCGGPLHRKDCAAHHDALIHPLDPGSAYR